LWKGFVWEQDRLVRIGSGAERVGLSAFQNNVKREEYGVPGFQVDKLRHKR
jgi:hypothetical protein